MAIDVAKHYAQYGPMVLRRCRVLLRNEADAVDAMHDTFVRLLRYSTRVDERGMSSLLFRMATNVCLNRIKAQKSRREDAAGDLLRRIAAAGDRLDAALTARALLSRLFAREEDSTLAIAIMLLVDHMTLEQVATEVGLSVSGVRRRLRQLRAHLVELEGV